MKMKSAVVGAMIGVGGTLMYQQMRNGNMKKMIRDVKRFSKNAYDDLEDMM